MAFENTAVESGTINDSRGINQNVAAHNAVSEQTMQDAAGLANSAASEASNLHTRAINQGEAYFAASAQAAQQAQYADKFRQASSMFAEAYQERLNKQYDDNGNPTFRALPGDTENIGADIASKVGGSINDPEVANKFNEQFSNYITQQKAQSYSTARNQELGYIKGNLAVSLQTYSDVATTGNPGDRLHAVAEMNQQIDSAVTTGALHPYEATKLKEEFRGEINKNVIRAAVEQDPYSAKDMLDQPEKYGLYLNESEKVKLNREVNQQIKIVDNQNKAAQAAQAKEFNGTVKDINSRLMSGEQIDPKELDQFQAQATAAGFENQANAVVDQANTIQAFSLLSPEERQAELNNLASASGQGEFYKTLLKTDAKLNKELKEDPFGLGIRQKIVGNTALKPLDLTGDLDKQLQYRNALAEKIQGAQGGSVPPLMSKEIETLASQLPSLPTEDKMRLFGAMAKNLPEDRAHDLYAKLDKNGAGEYAYAGSLVAGGNRAGASRILSGLDLQKTKVYTLSKSLTDEANLNEIKIAFADPGTQAQVQSAIRAAYISMANDAGVSNEDINRDIMKAAIKTAVGNVIEDPIGGKTNIVLPKQASEGSFNAWLDTEVNTKLREAVIRVGDASLGADEVASAFRSNGKLVQRDANSYYPYIKTIDKTFIPVRDKAGKAIILSYPKE